MRSPKTNSSARVVLPVVLAYVAGYVDGCTFVALFGLFVAQVTGSFVVAGAVFSTRHHAALTDLLAIPGFIFGAALGTALNAIAGRRNWPAEPLLLALETLLVAAMLGAALLAGDPQTSDRSATMLIGLLGLCAMGVQNAFVRLRLQGAPSTNVMTTNTGQLAIDATELLIALVSPGDPNAAETGAARRRLVRTVPVVAGFLAGTVCGTLACHETGLVCLVAPVAILATAAFVLARRAAVG